MPKNLLDYLYSNYVFEKELDIKRLMKEPIRYTVQRIKEVGSKKSVKTSLRIYIKHDIPKLKKEISILQGLNSLVLPKVIQHKIFPEGAFLETQCFGISLEKKLHQSPSFFTPTKIYSFMAQVVYQLQELHKIGFIHNFLNLKNIRFKQNSDSVIFITNFENAIWNGKNPNELNNFNYTSVSTLNGNPCQRQDDLESFFYVLFHLLHGNLPWYHLGAGTVNEELLQILQNMKKNIRYTPFFKTLPVQVRWIYYYISGLDADDDIDYQQIHNSLLYHKSCSTKKELMPTIRESLSDVFTGLKKKDTSIKSLQCLNEIPSISIEQKWVTNTYKIIQNTKVFQFEPNNLNVESSLSSGFKSSLTSSMIQKDFDNSLIYTPINVKQSQVQDEPILKIQTSPIGINSEQIKNDYIKIKEQLADQIPSAINNLPYLISKLNTFTNEKYHAFDVFKKK